MAQLSSASETDFSVEDAERAALSFRPSWEAIEDNASIDEDTTAEPLPTETPAPATVQLQDAAPVEKYVAEIQAPRVVVASALTTESKPSFAPLPETGFEESTKPGAIRMTSDAAMISDSALMEESFPRRRNRTIPVVVGAALVIAVLGGYMFSKTTSTVSPPPVEKTIVQAQQPDPRVDAIAAKPSLQEPASVEPNNTLVGTHVDLTQPGATPEKRSIAAASPKNTSKTQPSKTTPAAPANKNTAANANSAPKTSAPATPKKPASDTIIRETPF